MVKNQLKVKLFDIGPGVTVRAGSRQMNTLSVEHLFLEQIRFVRGVEPNTTLGDNTVEIPYLR